MDSAEEARDYDAMDHGNGQSSVRERFSDALAPARGRCWMSAPAPDRFPSNLCRQHPTAEVQGIDLAEHMLAVGRANVQRLGLGKRIRLEKMDAKALPYSDGSSAAIMSNSIVHHIPEPFRVLAEMARVLEPGGVIFVRDLLRPESDRDV